jgi:hypothetical protein
LLRERCLIGLKCGWQRITPQPAAADRSGNFIVLVGI